MRGFPIPNAKAAWGALIGTWLVVSFSSFAEAGDGDETLAPPTRALPGLWRTAVALPHAPGTAVSAATGYGYTEAVLGQNDAHHRARGALAVSYRPNSWLGFAASFDARYDRHVGDGIDDRGYIGDPRLSARALRRAPGPLTLGAEATLWLPGDDAPSLVASAASLDAKAIAAYRPREWGRHTLHASAGFRVDRSAASAPDADRLSLAQRLALGVSDSDALLAGAAWSARYAPATVFAEWSWDVLVGADAPAPQRSPMRLGAGVHWSVADRYRVFGVAELGVSARPGVERGDALVPVEPRASFMAGLSYHLGGSSMSSAEPASSGVLGKVVTPEGEPVAGARVRVRAGRADERVETDAGGVFRARGLPAGRAGIVATASGYLEQTAIVDLAPNGRAEVAITLEPDRPGSQLKGLVLSFGGEPIPAAIRIEPGGVELSAGRDGSFEVDLAPGEYEVSIAARGHRDQVRVVTVERRGVTVLNVDMRRER